MSLVVDASTVVAVLTDGRTEPARRARRRLAAADEVLVAPHLIDLEVLSALRRIALLKRPQLVDAALGMFRLMPIERYPHTGLIPRIWQLRHDIGPYDAAYVALAESLDVPLLTMDRRLAGASGHMARVLLP